MKIIKNPLFWSGTKNQVSSFLQVMAEAVALYYLAIVSIYQAIYIDHFIELIGDNLQLMGINRYPY